MPKENVGKYILDTAHLVKYELNTTFYRDNISGLQMRIMGFIHEKNSQGEDVHQRDLETEFKMRRSSVTSVINTMEKKGLVRRLPVPFDARLKKIDLTEKAKNIVEMHYEKIMQFENKILSNFSREEIENLKNLLEKVVENLDSTKRC